MTQNDFKELIQKHLRKHGLEKSPVKMTNARRTLGSVTYNRLSWDVEFKFSRHLVDANPGVAENTILHEIAHALDIQTRGTSDHGFEWKKIAREIGADPSATANHPYDDLIYRYHIICESCGTIMKKRHNLTKSIRRKIKFNLSYHGPCGTSSKLKIIDNIKPVVPVNVPAQEPSATFKASELAKIMGICPKKARRNLRAAGVDHLKIGKSWVFAAKHENLIKEIISK